MARGVLSPRWVLACAALAACRAETIPVVDCTSNAECASGTWCGTEHACVTYLALVPNSDGHVDDASNALGVEGFWRVSADGYDESGQRGGTCQVRGGHPDPSCSVITQPDPSLGVFPNQDGVMCSAGISKLVLSGGGQDDYWNIWGAEQVFDFAPGGDRAGVFDADLAGIGGISFEIHDAAPAGMRVEFLTGNDTSNYGPAYWGAGVYFPPSPVRAGKNLILFDEVRVPKEATPFPPSKLDAIRFHFPATTVQDQPYSACVGGLSLLGKRDPALQTPDARASPPAILIDDFEDQDGYPLDPRFDHWQDYTFGPHEEPVLSVTAWEDSAAADASNGGMNLEWEFRDPPDGAVQGAGVGVRSLISTTQVYLDLSAYSRLVFSHRYEHAVDARVPDLGLDCSASSEIAVSFECPEYGASFTALVPVASSYETALVPFRLFAQAASDPKRVAIEDCLTRVETWNFQMTLALSDGQCGSGHLFLDNVSLR